MPSQVLAGIGQTGRLEKEHDRKAALHDMINLQTQCAIEEIAELHIGMITWTSKEKSMAFRVFCSAHHFKDCGGNMLVTAEWVEDHGKKNGGLSVPSTM